MTQAATGAAAPGFAGEGSTFRAPDIPHDCHFAIELLEKRPAGQKAVFWVAA
jgi:hypothetical protein